MPIRPKSIAPVVFAGLSVAGLTHAAANAAPQAAHDEYTLNVAIVIYDGVELLDFAGPGEVFEIAGGFARHGERRGYNVYTVGVTDEPIVSQGFVTVTPNYGIDSAPPPDVLVIPGGQGPALHRHQGFLDWTKAVAEEATVMTVCTGAFVAAEVGLLAGLEVTTWHGQIERLRDAAPAATVISGTRFVDNGGVVTTAGVSAGVDGALHVVARTFGRVVADQTARYMEYHWSPEPALAAKYPLMNPRVDDDGRRWQKAQLAFAAEDWGAAADIFTEIVRTEPDNPSAWHRYGYALHASGRHAEAVEAFRRLATFARHRALGLYNTACALAMGGERAAALDALEEAVEAGFERPDLIRSEADLVSLHEQPRFKRLLERLEEEK